MELNKMIDVANEMPRTKQQEAMVQDNVAKTNFALKMMERMAAPKKPEEPPARIPSLGALAIPN